MVYTWVSAKVPGVSTPRTAEYARVPKSWTTDYPEFLEGTQRPHTFNSFFWYCLAHFCFADNQAEQDIEDSPTLFRGDSLKSGGGLSNEPLVDTLVAYARQVALEGGVGGGEGG